ncbi:MAG TPA: Ig-like domain repeat protein, partial [Pyrinomonadaceae bacterium]|nr:Ig-like domain repeat protein [Pyrinomonadaceae bacterium]
MFNSFAKHHSVRVFIFALAFAGLASWATSRSYLLSNPFVTEAALPATTADLAISKTASPSAGVAQGAQMNYTITVSNGGPDAATDVNVNDPLPAGTTFVSVTPSQGSCTAPAPGNPGTVNCSLGTIASPGSATIALVVTFTGAPGSSISNTATVSTTAVDGNSTNDSATTTAVVAQTVCPVVTNNSDAGPGSLRSAIGCANGNPGLDAITFNIPGAGVHTITPLSPLPSINSPVFIDGYSQPGSSPNTQVSSDNAVLTIELSGASAGPAAGFLINAPGSGSTVRGLIVNRFGAQGITLNNGSTGSVVEGNFVGTNATGTSALGNSVGVSVFGAQNSTVGGTTPRARNVISGNLGNGVFVANGSTNNVVQGNLIGTDASGTAAVPNASLNPNGAAGIFITGGAQNNTIGGSAAPARNVISGNKGVGVEVSFASRNNILGNYIGTDAAGSMSLGNFHRGVMLTSASVNKVLGNLLSGNDGAGLSIENGANGNQVQGNLVGTKADGTSALGNSQFGVLIDRASNSTLTTNTVAFNGSSTSTSAGVIVTTFDPSSMSNGTSAGNAIHQNSIYSNFGLGIDLYSGGAFGVTPNDLCDGDVGANNFQNSPVLTSLSSASGNTTIQGTLNSSPNTTFTIEFFSNVAADPSGSGEGQTYLGSTTVTTGADCNAIFSFAFPDNPGQPVITATATDPAGNTSEFSAWMVTTTTTLASDNNPSTYGQTVTFTATVSSSAGTPTGTVTFKDGATILGTGTLNGSGQATLTTSSLSTGTHAITAVYEGTSNYLSS